MDQESANKAWADVVAKAWADQSFKKRLLADPAAALKELKLSVPGGLQVKVVEDTDNLVYLHLPAKPSSGELSEAELNRAAGGFIFLPPRE